MKISDAWIYDPSLTGTLSPPELCVQVDEEPDATIKPEEFANGWVVGKYGPFVKYEYLHGTKVTAVDFNSAFRDRFPMVIDITLVVGPEDSDNEVIFDTYSLPLSRARQLVKKYSPNWRLLVSDREAVHGKLFWRPVESDPACRGDGGSCKKKPALPIRVSNTVELPMCASHIKAYNSAQAQARALSSSK